LRADAFRVCASHDLEGPSIKAFGGRCLLKKSRQASQTKKALQFHLYRIADAAAITGREAVEDQFVNVQFDLRALSGLVFRLLSR
jgi:hypothetical protein